MVILLLVILALYFSFLGFVPKEFIGLGSNFFLDNSIFIQPVYNEADSVFVGFYSISYASFDVSLACLPCVFLLKSGRFHTACTIKDPRDRFPVTLELHCGKQLVLSPEFIE